MMMHMEWTASSMGKKGAKVRHERLTPERRSAIASKAAKAKKGLKYKKKTVFHSPHI